VTSSQLALETVRHTGVFEPYPAPIAREYPNWLSAPDYSWLSFTAWPRVAMINRRVLGDDTVSWPAGLEDLCDARYRDRIGCASLVEATTVAQFAGLRIAKGDAYVEQLLDRLRANGLRIFHCNLDTREPLVREDLAALLANSSHVHVFHLEGNAVEAWLDQEEDEVGTHVEAHTVAVLKGCKEPERARDFVDFLLTAEIQSLLHACTARRP